jgi:hypothetical protein
MTKEEVLASQIEQIMDEFDFDQVRDIMKKVDWKWGHGEDMEVPSGNAIRKCAKTCLIEAAKGEQMSCSTGGFMAIKVVVDNTARMFLFFGVDSALIEFDHEDFKEKTSKGKKS